MSHKRQPVLRALHQLVQSHLLRLVQSRLLLRQQQFHMHTLQVHLAMDSTAAQCGGRLGDLSEDGFVERLGDPSEASVSKPKSTAHYSVSCGSFVE